MAGRNSADLLALETSVGTLSPDFASEAATYDLAVPAGTPSGTLTSKVTNLFATYTITADTDSSVTNDTVDLSPGDNVITITVTAADETTRCPTNPLRSRSRPTESTWFPAAAVPLAARYTRWGPVLTNRTAGGALRLP